MAEVPAETPTPEPPVSALSAEEPARVPEAPPKAPAGEASEFDLDVVEILDPFE